MNERKILIEANNLKVYFKSNHDFLAELGLKKRKMIRAVDGVSFYVYENETLAIVGESGCGKSTLGRALVGLNSPTEGSIIFEGRDIGKEKKEGNIKKLRRNLQFVFQDPFSSLNPRLRISETIGRPLEIHGQLYGDKKEERIDELLTLVGLSPYHKTRYPHEFSGGQKQRISIARALAARPKFIVADEPTSALDVSVQCQILNLLKDLKTEYNLSMVFISHDLDVVRYISDRVVVMYLGRIVESGLTSQIFENPLHPYTRALLSAVPAGPGERKKRFRLVGNIPSILNIPKGCRLHPRCPFATDICSLEEPMLTNIEDEHSVCCHNIKV
jgi:oligopeptide transport system ATP-binding protein